MIRYLSIRRNIKLSIALVGVAILLGIFSVPVPALAASTATPRPTATPTPLPIVKQPVLTITPFPAAALPILPENAARLSEIARWGKGRLNALALSPDGLILAVAATLGVDLYDAHSMQLLRTIPSAVNVTHLAFSPDSKVLAAGMNDALVRLWDANTGTELRRVDDFDAWTGSLTFSADGQRLAVASLNNVIVWDTRTWKQMVSLEGHFDQVTCVAFSPDGGLLATGSADHTVRLWDAASGKMKNILRRHRDETCATFSQDGRILATWSVEGVQIWDLNGNPIRFLGGHNGFTRTVAISPDSRFLASGGTDRIVKVWNLTNFDAPVILTGAGCPVVSAQFANDGRTLYAGGLDGAWAWDTGGWQLVGALEGYLYLTGSAALPADGSALVTVMEENVLRLWNTTSGRAISILRGHKEALTPVFSPDGKWIATGSWDHKIKVWNASTGVLLYTLEGFERSVVSLAFSPNSALMAAGFFDGMVKIWEVNGGKEIHTLAQHEGAVTSVVFSPHDNILVAGADDRVVRFWSVNSGKELLAFSGRNGRVILLFTPDGKTLISWSEGEGIMFWDTSDGHFVSTLGDRYFGIGSLALSANGRLLAIAMNDATIHVWDITNKRELIVLRGHTQVARTLVFTKDGKRLVSVSADGSIRWWGVKP